MVGTIKQALGFMRTKEKIIFSVFLALRALVAFLDLIGILGIGYLATSVAFLFTQEDSSSQKIQLGSVQLPAMEVSLLPTIAGIILFLFISKAVSSILLTKQLANFLARIEARSARVIAKNAFGLGLERAKLHSREEVVFAVQVGSPSAFNIILNAVGTITAEGFLFIVVIWAFVFVNPAAAFGALLFFGLIAFVIHFFIGKMMHQSGLTLAKSTIEANESLSDLGEVLRESIILGRQRVYFDRIFNSRLRASGSAATQWVLLGMPRYIVETALILAIALFIILQALSGEIATSVGTVGIFLSGGLRLTASLLPLQSALLSIKQAITPAISALDIIRETSATGVAESSDGKLLIDTAPLGISIRGLRFSHLTEGPETLSDISLDVESGSQVAFIGSSGAGKSTLADVIMGLLEPNEGKILVGGLNPIEIIKAHPGVLGYVPQKPGLVSGSIVENITLGEEEEAIDQANLRRAIEDANLESLISTLPNGLNTDIGKRKDAFSGGQLQRIGLARALYRNPRLLILDEATSALDAESENEINIALGKMKGRVTVILIAHRLNTIQRCDEVFLLDSGKISASGTFQELVAFNSNVKNLANLMSIEHGEK